MVESPERKTSLNQFRFWVNTVDPVLSWGFGVILLLAAVPHWDNPYFFLGSVYSYNLVGAVTGQAVALFLPSIQLIIAVCLITRLFIDAAHLCTLALFSAFLVVQLSAYWGGLNISCGCFGAFHADQFALDFLYRSIMDSFNIKERNDTDVESSDLAGHSSASY